MVTEERFALVWELGELLRDWTAAAWDGCVWWLVSEAVVEAEESVVVGAVAAVSISSAETEESAKYASRWA